MILFDTIAAIATATGDAGIAVVRISGPEAIPLAERVFRGPHPPPSARETGTFTVGRVVDASGTVIDQALLLLMRAPRSYTGEDVVELQGHGGRQCARRLLRCLLDAGARLAHPGEFTQRAFLHGRLDLLQAESVLDLIHARSDRAATAAMEQLEGSISKSIETIYDNSISVAGDLEASLDFPEDELPETVLPDVRARLTGILKAIDEWIATWDEGHFLREGAVVVISGRPNVGKSTLLNALLGRARAIVSDTPGTTRDTIEEAYVLGGIPVRLIDTAGLRDSACAIEQQGIERTHTEMQRADFHLHLLDATQRVTDEDRNMLASLPRDRTLVLHTKADLAHAPGEPAEPTALRISLLADEHIAHVRRKLEALVHAHAGMQTRPHATISERHRRLLCTAREDIQTALDCLKTEQEEGILFAANHLRSALEPLGHITGRIYNEDLLTQIFSRFCIGK